MKNNTYCDSYIRVFNEFSVGLEVEFFIKDEKYNEKFLKEYLKDVGESTEHDEYDSLEYLAEQTDYTDYVIGFDGAGVETKELRTPVFHSKNPQSCLDDLLNFSVDMQAYLIGDFRAQFRPMFGYCPYGLHFSIGGDFLQWNIANGIIDRAHKLQENFVKFIPKRILPDYLDRESEYPGDFFISLESLQDCKNINSYNNGLRISCDYEEPVRVEFRFFPSCFVYSLEEAFKFMVLDNKYPTKKLRFSRS